MTMEGPNGAETAEEADVLQRATEELAQVQARIGPRFRRAKTRQRAACFLQGLLTPVERKNGRQLAEHVGEQGPHGVQRLLGEADWDEEAVRTSKVSRLPSVSTAACTLLPGSGEKENDVVA